jgi:RNA polymerase sigma factor (sigma-70 family)
MALRLFNRNPLEDATGELCLEPEGITQMGEDEALEQKVTRIFQALRLPVYYYLLAFLGDAATADDLTQEVFLRLYAHLHRGRPVENVRLWTFRVAHNLAFDERQRNQRLARLDESAWDEICARLPDPALYALHRLKADLGEQIEIARESNEQIVVRGQVETPERKQELIAALRGIPLVAARIQTFDEATTQAQVTIALLPDANDDRSPIAGVNQFERRLARYFAERSAAAPPSSPEDAAAINRRIAQLANSAFAEASAALAGGWALRRLVERFDDGPDEQTNEQMSAAAAARLPEVISNHLAEINTRSRNLRTLLEPALISIAGTRDSASPSPQPAEGTRKARVMRLFKAVEQVQRLSYRLFDSGQAFAASPEEAARLMLQALEQLDAARLALERDGHR